MTTTIDELLVKIDASTELLRRELNKGDGDIARFAQKADARLDDLDRRFARVGSTLRTALGAFGISVGISELARFGSSAVAAAADVARVSREVDLSAETLQGMRGALVDIAGVTRNQVDAGLRTFHRNLGLAARGGNEVEAAFKRAGVEVRRAGGAARETEPALEDTLRQLAAMEDDATRAAEATKFFGEEFGVRLSGALDNGIEAINRARAATAGYSEQATRDAELIIQRSGRFFSNLWATVSDTAIEGIANWADFFGLIDRRAAELEQFGEVGARARERMREVAEALEDVRAAARSGVTGLADTIADLETQYRNLERLARANPPSFAERRRILSGLGAAPERGPFTEAGKLPRIDMTGAGDRDYPRVLLDRGIVEGSEEVREHLRQLEEQTLRAQGRIAEAIRLNADAQIRNWKLLAEEGKATAEESTRAIVLVNERAAAEIAALGDESKWRVREFGSAVAAAFESRGIEALMNGRLREGVRGFTKDLVELIIRLTVLKPLAEKIAEALGNIGKGKGDAKGAFIGSLLGGLLGFESGGRPPMGRASIVGESGPEFFIPDVPGRILSNAQSRALVAAGRGVTVNITQNIEAGLPPQWEAQLVTVGQMAAGAAHDAVMSRLSGRR
jgi:hypothetical protein